MCWTVVGCHHLLIYLYKKLDHKKSKRDTLLHKMTNDFCQNQQKDRQPDYFNIHCINILLGGDVRLTFVWFDVWFA